MKKPFPCKILYLLLLPLIYFSSSAQTNTRSLTGERFGFDMDMGLAIPTSKDINPVFYTGGNIALGFKMAALPSKKLWVKPAAGMKFYTKKTGDKSDNITENFLTVKAGIELQYRAAEGKRYALYPLLRIDHNWSSNYFSKTYEYNPVTNTQTIGVSDKYLKGTGFSFDAGVMLANRSHWYLKADYEYYRPALKVQPALVSAALAEGIVIPSETLLNCSTINIGVGINFNFK